jgi:hypothetical protein
MGWGAGVNLAPTPYWTSLRFLFITTGKADGYDYVF